MRILQDHKGNEIARFTCLNDALKEQNAQRYKGVYCTISHEGGAGGYKYYGIRANGDYFSVVKLPLSQDINTDVIGYTIDELSKYDFFDIKSKISKRYLYLYYQVDKMEQYSFCFRGKNYMKLIWYKVPPEGAKRISKMLYKQIQQKKLCIKNI